MAIGSSGLGGMSVDLSMNIARFERAISKAERLSRQKSERMARAFKVVGSAFAAVAGVGGIGLFIKRSVDLANNIEKMSREINTSSEFLTEMKHAANLADVGIDTLTKSLSKMQKNASDAAMGLSTPKRALEELGISVTNFVGLNAEQQFKLIAERMDSVKDSSTRTRVAMDIFGRSGRQLLRMFAEGSGTIEKYRKEARQLNLVIGTDTARGAAAAKDAMTRMGAVFEGLGNFLITRLAPYFERLNDYIVAHFIPTLRNMFDLLEGGMAVAKMDTADAQAALEGMINAVQARIIAFERIARESNWFGKWITQVDEGDIKRKYKELDKLRDQLAGFMRDMPEPKIPLHDFDNLSGAEERLRIAAAGAKDELEKQTKALTEKDEEFKAVKKSTDKLAESEKLFATEMAKALEPAEQYKRSLVEQQNEYDSLIDKIAALDEAYQENKIGTRLYKEELERLQERLGLVGEETKKTTELSDTFKEKLAEVDQELQNRKKRVEDLFKDFGRSVFESWVGFWERALNGSIDSFKDFVDAVVDQFKAMIARLIALWTTSKLFDILGIDAKGFNISIPGFSFGGKGGVGVSLPIPGSGKAIDAVKSFFGFGGASGAKTFGLGPAGPAIVGTPLAGPGAFAFTGTEAQLAAIASEHAGVSGVSSGGFGGLGGLTTGGAGAAATKLGIAGIAGFIGIKALGDIFGGGRPSPADYYKMFGREEFRNLPGVNAIQAARLLSPVGTPKDYGGVFKGINLKNLQHLFQSFGFERAWTDANEVLNHTILNVERLGDELVVSQEHYDLLVQAIEDSGDTIPGTFENIKQRASRAFERLSEGSQRQLANLERYADTVSLAMEDGFVSSWEALSFGIRDFGGTTAEVFREMVNQARAAQRAVSGVGAVVGGDIPVLPPPEDYFLTPHRPENDIGDLGAAHGGRFKVGGTPGVDNNVVRLRATAGEILSVDPPGSLGGADITKELRSIVRLLTKQNSLLQQRYALS